MSTHSLVDIHTAENEAQKKIEDTKKHNDKQILEARDKEEEAFQAFIEEEKEAGMELIKKAKEEANVLAKQEMTAGEHETTHVVKEAKMRSDQAMRRTVQAFTDYVNA